jgi:3-methyladenine DNA glycosylase AlkC
MIQKEKFSLKDHLYHPEKIRDLGTRLQSVDSKFPKEKFISAVLGKFPELELKDRIRWITKVLRECLPENYEKALRILLEALPEPCDPDLSDGDFGDFIYAPFSEYVASFGCNSKDLELSLNALREITKRFSAEFGIRPFLHQFPKQTLKKLYEFTEDPHYHVRRLASEGTRPNLPWGGKINLPISETLPILNNLYSDSTRYVTRSVANHMNDLSKIEKDIVYQTLKRWSRTGKQSHSEMDFIIKHSLRTSIKEGDPIALSMLGIPTKPSALIMNPKFPRKVFLNESGTLSFQLKTKKPETIILDYTLHYQNKSGRMDRKRNFKIKTIQAQTLENLTIAKEIHFPEKISTRVLYPGKHLLELRINGISVHSLPFELVHREISR